MNLLKFLAGLDPETILASVLRHVTPQIAKPVLLRALKKTSDLSLEKLGRLLTMAGEKCLKHDRAGAAGDLARVLGDIKP